MDIFKRSTLEKTGENLTNIKKCYKYFVPTNNGWKVFKLKRDTECYINNLNKNVTIYFDNMHNNWSLDYIIYHETREFFHYETISGGYNIYGHKLDDIQREVYKYKVTKSLGDNIKKFKKLKDCLDFVSENNFKLTLKF